MTLLLNVITPDYVLQASDRRLTLESGELVEDDATKAILFQGSFALGFTGMARLPVSRRVSPEVRDERQVEHSCIWLQRVLNTCVDCVSLDDWVYVVTCELNDAIQRALNWFGRPWPVAFFGVGWSTDENGRNLEPIFVEISNLSSGGRTASSQIVNRPKFGTWNFILRPSKPLRSDVHCKLEYQLKKLKDRQPAPEAVGRYLILAIREVAKYDKTVGTIALVACVPRKHVERGGNGEPIIIEGGFPSLEIPTFRYDRDGTTEGVQYAPYLAGVGLVGTFGLAPGGQIVLNERAHPS